MLIRETVKRFTGGRFRQNGRTPNERIFYLIFSVIFYERFSTRAPFVRRIASVLGPNITRTNKLYRTRHMMYEYMCNSFSTLV